MDYYGYIYITTNEINNKKYIGQHKGNKEDSYIGSGKLLKEAIKKYGKENFSKEIIEYGSSLEELNELEKYYINLYNAVDSEDFYNIAEGGNGGSKIAGFSEEELENFKKQCSLRSSGEKNPMFGKHHTEETKIKISENKNREYQKTPEFGEKNPMFGKKHSEESKKKMSDNSKGKSSGEKNGMFNKSGENAINGKIILMKDIDGNVIRKFNTMKLALEWLGIKGHTGLDRAIKNRKEYHKYYWEKMDRKSVETNL